MEDPNKKESVADVLARMQEELSFNVEEFMDPAERAQRQQAQSERETRTQQAIAPPASPPAVSSTEQRAMNLVDQANEAIQQTDDQPTDVGQYMDSLLGRYQADDESGQQTPPAEEPKEESTTSPPVAKTTPEVAASAGLVQPLTDLPVVPQLLNHNEYLPQKKAPEGQASIAAMRELAVLSARKAIQDSAQRQRGLDASFRMTLGISCAVLGLGSFYLAEGLFTIMGMLGIASVVGAGAFFVNWKSTVKQPPINSNQNS